MDPNAKPVHADVPEPQVEEAVERLVEAAANATVQSAPPSKRFRSLLVTGRAVKVRRRAYKRNDERIELWVVDILLPHPLKREFVRETIMAPDKKEALRLGTKVRTILAGAETDAEYRSLVSKIVANFIQAREAIVAKRKAVDAEGTGVVESQAAAVETEAAHVEAPDGRPCEEEQSVAGGAVA